MKRTFQAGKPDKARRSRRRRRPVFAEFRREDQSDSGEATDSARNSSRRNSAPIIRQRAALTGSGRGAKRPSTRAAAGQRHDRATGSRGFNGVWRGLALVGIGAARNELTFAGDEARAPRLSEWLRGAWFSWRRLAVVLSRLGTICRTFCRTFWGTFAFTVSV